MSCAALIRKDESHFNLAHRIVSVIVENNSLNFDDTWLQVSTNTIQQLQKRFRRLKRANNPLVNVKKPRTSFSFFTKNRRTKIASENPKATFGELSKLVSKAWAALSDKERAVYKKMETDDKLRYNKEKEEVLANLPAKNESTTEAVETTTVEEESTQPKKRKTTSNKSEAKATKSSTNTSKTTTTTSTSTSTSASKPVKPYNAFQKEQRPLIKKSDPTMALKDVNSKLGSLWKALSTEEKAAYGTVTA